MRIRMFTAWAVAALVVCATGATASAAFIIDDFQSYSHGAIIADTASSGSPRPWIRFGAATATNVIATTAAAEAINGVSARYGLNWTLGNNGNIRRKYDTAFDLSPYTDAQVTAKALSGAAAGTLVKFAFTDGTTNWTSTVGQPLTTTATTMTFAISSGAMTRTAGSGTFAATLANTNGLSFRFENAGATGSTTVVVDDFMLAPLPEPAAAALLAIGIVALGARRPRRPHREVR